MSAIQATDETFDPFVLIHQSVTTRLQTVEAELETAEQKSRDLEASLERVRDLADESRVVEKHLLNNLKQFSPSEVQETFGNIRETQLSVERVQIEYEALASRRAEFKNSVRNALEETRQLIFDLRPMTLDDLGLVPTLRKFIKEYGDRYGLATRFNVVGQERRLVGNTEGVLFRIVQEALTNVHKHARAKMAEVTMNLQPSRVSVVVKDDGQGFDVARTEANLHKNKNLGLLSMRERAELEKGTLEIRSQPGRGTAVKVEIPLAKR